MLQFHTYLVEYYLVADRLLSEIIYDIPIIKFLEVPFDEEDCG